MVIENKTAEMISNLKYIIEFKFLKNYERIIQAFFKIIHIF